MYPTERTENDMKKLPQQIEDCTDPTEYTFLDTVAETTGATMTDTRRCLEKMSRQGYIINHVFIMGREAIRVW